MEALGVLEFLWNEGEHHLRVFLAVERCLGVNIFDVGAGVAGVFGTDDAVVQHLGVVVKLAERVVSLPGYLMRFLPTVMHTRLGSSVCAQ